MIVVKLLANNRFSEDESFNFLPSSFKNVLPDEIQEAISAQYLAIMLIDCD